MPKRLQLSILFIAILSGCTLDDINHYGDRCPPDGIDGELSYIKEPTCTAESCSIGDYAQNFQNKMCPSDVPECARDDNDRYYCATIQCEEDQHIYHVNANRMIWKTAVSTIIVAPKKRPAGRTASARTGNATPPNAKPVTCPTQANAKPPNAALASIPIRGFAKRMTLTIAANTARHVTALSAAGSPANAVTANALRQPATNSEVMRL